MNDSPHVTGIVLAGGTGSRLAPLTATLNKHLLPVRGKPMLHWPLRTLAQAGVEDVVVVLGGRSCGEVVEQFGSTYDTGSGVVSVCYVYQPTPGGIADALLCTRRVVERSGPETVAVVLGDNVFSSPVDGLGATRETALAVGVTAERAAERYGCAAVNATPSAPGSTVDVDDVVEKPRCDPPPGKRWLAISGAYAFPATGEHSCFDLASRLGPSRRGELEVADLLSAYGSRGLLRVAVHTSPWHDAGDHDGYARANGSPDWTAP